MVFKTNDLERCGKMDTTRSPGFDIRRLCSPLAILLALVSSAPAVYAAKGPDDSGARVVALRGPDLYVLLADSAQATAGDTLILWEGSKERARASVWSVVRGGLAIAILSPGAYDIARAKRLEKLLVTVAKSAVARPASWRIGFPSRERSAPLRPCDDWRFQSPRGGGAPPYFVEAVDRRRVRFLRDRSRAGEGEAAAWPDTIVVHLFDEAADEEIALERGDVDAAIFWTGELSSRLRGDARWLTEVEPVAGDSRRSLLAPVASRRLIAAIGASPLYTLHDCAPPPTATEPSSP
jgi:hypothetical protein